VLLDADRFFVNIAHLLGGASVEGQEGLAERRSQGFRIIFMGGLGESLLLVDALCASVGILQCGLDLAGNGLLRAERTLSDVLVESGHVCEELIGDTVLVVDFNGTLENVVR